MRDVRLDVRLPAADKDRIGRAAAADGLTMSQFVRTAVSGRTDAVLAELHEITLLDAEVHAHVLERLTEPAVPTAETQELVDAVVVARQVLLPEEVARLHTEPCVNRHLRHTFVSHDPDLDEWFRTGAWLSEGTHCYVWCSRGYDEVDGFYMLTGHRLARHGPTERGERSVIGLRLTHLATGRWHPRVDFEALLLLDAMARAADAASAGSAQFLAVRPRSEAQRLALKAHGLWEVPGSDLHVVGLTR